MHNQRRSGATEGLVDTKMVKRVEVEVEGGKAEGHIVFVAAAAATSL